MKGILRAEYLYRILQEGGLKRRALYLQYIIDKYHIDFDSIAIRGNSGAIMGGALSLITNKPLILVRKKDDDNHSVYNVEGYTGVRRYIIVDDLISTGDTIGHIIADIREHLHTEAKCVAVLLYSRMCNGCDVANKHQVPIYSIDDNSQRESLPDTWDIVEVLPEPLKLIESPDMRPVESEEVIVGSMVFVKPSTWDHHVIKWSAEC